MRNRIGSVKATQKITKAMQMVAAAKLKRAQDQAESARPYAKKMASVIANLAAGSYTLTRLSDSSTQTVSNGSVVDGMRITIGAPEQNQALLDALGSLL